MRNLPRETLSLDDFLPQTLHYFWSRKAKNIKQKSASLGHGGSLSAQLFKFINYLWGNHPTRCLELGHMINFETPESPLQSTLKWFQILWFRNDFRSPGLWNHFKTILDGVLIYPSYPFYHKYTLVTPSIVTLRNISQENHRSLSNFTF